MEIGISVAAKIVVNAIQRQVEYILFYNDNFIELKHRLEELKAVKDTIVYDVEVERRNGREIKIAVKSWLNRVDRILEEAQQFCEDPRHAKVGCSRWSFPNLKSRHQLSQTTKKMAKYIAEMCGKGKFDGVGYLLDSMRGAVKLESRNLMNKDIILTLRDPKVSKIGVYGLMGVGKTTLVAEIARQVKDDKLFDEVVMAVVSQVLDLERIQGDIADQLGLHLTKVERAIRLCERIKKEKTILIILDDIWETIDLEKLGIPSQDNHKGCKLLLVSRFLNILQKNETQKDFQLKVLNDIESWSLFEIMVGDVVEYANLQNIATQVARSCAGLPILIETMAKSLKNKNIYYWQDALNNLKRVDNGEMLEIVFSALKFSYDQLEDEVKKVFLLCGVHGTTIFVSDLLKYIIGLGVFKHINTIEDARNKLYEMIGDLKASCLLFDNDASAGMIKMHDIACEVAISIASMDQYAFIMTRNARLQDWPSEDFLERCTQIILKRCYIQKLPEKLDCPNMKVFHLDSTDNLALEIPNSFFKGMGNLEVLDLTGIIMSSLPTSLASLIKLKTLCLGQCSLKDMAGIGALRDLEVLSFIHSSMEELPASEIGQLTHLRMLDLSTSRIEVIPPNILSKLNKLEELYMGNTLIKWEVESSVTQNKNASLVEFRHLTSLTTLEIQISEAWVLPKDIMFEKLKRYKIVIGDTWKWPNKNRALRLLKLKLDTSIHLQHGIKTLIKKVEDLYLDEINDISNVLFDLNDEGFPLLKHLHIQNNGEIRHIINSMEWNQTHVLFPNLETLILHNLNNLEKICHGSLVVDTFGKLKVIKVKSCGSLRHLLLPSSCLKLRTLDISDCDMLKEIFIDIEEEKIDEKIFLHLESIVLENLPMLSSFSLETFEFPSLIKVRIVDCPALETFSKNVSATTDFFFLITDKLSTLPDLTIDGSEQLKKYMEMELTNLSFSQLKILKAIRCDEELNKFLSILLRRSHKLEQLTVENCKLLEQVFDLGDFVADEEGNGKFPNLSTMRLFNLPNLNCIWNKDPRGIVELSKLVKLEIIECGLQKSLVSTALLENLVQLEELNIHSCEMIEEVVGEETEKQERSFPNLKNLQLVSLPKFIKFNSGNCNFKFPNLLNLTIENCPKMNAFTTGFLSTQAPTIEGTSNHMLDEIMDACPKLQMLKLVGLETFEEIWQGCVSTISVCEPNELEVDNLCNLKYIFPSTMLSRLEKLETLVVRNCSSLSSIVFQLTEETDPKLPMLRKLVLSCLPTLKHVFENDSIMVFRNLEIVQVKSCASLQQLLLPSCYLRLRKIEISDCNILEEIFIDTEEERTDEKNFHPLESIVLENLPVLSSFFLETFEFPSLIKVRIVNCPALVTFSRDVSATADNFLNMDSFDNMEELHLVNVGGCQNIWNSNPSSSSQCKLKIDPSNTLIRMEKLKKITVQSLNALEVLFDIKEDSSSGAGKMELLPQLDELELSDLPNMQLWKQEPKIPMFKSLTSLQIIRCRSINKLFSISVAEHLSVLRLLKLYDCENIVHVLQGGGKNNKEVFQNLECLILKLLPKLTSFCEEELDIFPKLQMVRVEDIPKMYTFAKGSLKTPKLKEVYLTYITKCWQGNLNETIKYLHKNQDKLQAMVRVTYQSTPVNSFRHCTDVAESSSQISDEQFAIPSEEREVILNEEELPTSLRSGWNEKGKSKIKEAM